jgi:cysteine synthase
MSVDKRVALASVGARVIITPNAPPSSPENFRNVAERMAAEHGWFLTDQFNNPANVRVHEETTAAEILEQTRDASEHSLPAPEAEEPSAVWAVA